jgi:choline dehydrogenase
VVEAGGFVKSLPDLPAPDLQFVFIPVDVIDHLTRPKGRAFTLSMLHLSPRSRGSITLRSSDPLEPPRVQPNYLAHEEDRAALLRGIRLVRQVIKTEPLAGMCSAERLPGPEVHSDHDLLEWTREYAQNGDHPVGSLRMGKRRAGGGG